MNLPNTIDSNDIKLAKKRAIITSIPLARLYTKTTQKLKHLEQLIIGIENPLYFIDLPYITLKTTLLI